MKKYTRVCARIDLDAIEHNMEMIHKNLSEGTRMMAVMKTDGYGHGATPIAKLLDTKEYMWGCAVATHDEAILLKAAGVTKPILVLGCVFPEDREEMIRNDIRMTCYTEERAIAVSELAVSMNKTAYIHVKLDTGMSRLGFPVDHNSLEAIERISKLPNLVMEGMYTHFSKADELDKSFTQKQIDNYMWMKKELLDRGVRFTYYHCSNSAGIIDLKEANMDLVRAGILTYGLYPSDDVKKENVPLRPAMELISHIVHVKWVEAGVPVSYGGTYVTTRKTKIATVPVGYGDGYPRSLSNKGYVLIHGKKAPIIGRICMDQFMVDVTDIENVEFADKVTLIGYDGEEHLPVEILSEMSGRFNYEFVCDLSKRIPREFLRHGEVIEQMDCFA